MKIENTLKLLVIAAFFLCSCTENRETKAPLSNVISEEVEENSSSNIIFLKNGINKIDLNADGVQDMVVSGHRNNSTAHDFNYYTFYVFDKDFKKNYTQPWNIVEILGNEKYNIKSDEGADGKLLDVFFLKNAKGQNQLILAEREFGESFADSGKVKFSYYDLTFDNDDRRFVYKLKSDCFSIRKYVDVDNAAAKVFQ